MRKGFSLLELIVAVGMLSILLTLITMAMKTGSDTIADMTERSLRSQEERRTVDIFTEHLRSAEPGSFYVTDMGDGCMFSFTAASGDAAMDVRGHLIHDIGYICEYSETEGTLSIESYYIHLIDEVYRPGVVLGGVKEFGIYYHKKYRALQVAIDDRISTISVRTPHEPNDEGRLNYTKPPFIPMVLYWSNRVAPLPIIADIEEREREDGSQEIDVDDDDDGPSAKGPKGKE